MRLKWILENNESVKKELKKNNLLFGTIDTWIIYKLTNGEVSKMILLLFLIEMYNII